MLAYGCIFSGCYKEKTARAADAMTGETYDATNNNKQEYVMTENSYIIPIRMSRDGLAEIKITVSGNSQKIHGSAAKKEINDIEYGSSYNEFYWHTWFEGTKKWSFGADSATTAYLLLTKDEKDYGTPIKITLQSEYFPADYGREIYPGKSMTLNQVHSEEYWKITLKRNSIVNIKGNFAHPSLYSREKKLIASNCSNEELCLQKGTYYIKTQQAGRHSLSYTAKAVNGTVGNNRTKSSAKKISLNQKTAGAFFCTSKVKSYYYKFSIKKKKNVVFLYENSIKNLCEWNLYNKAGKRICTLDTWSKKGKIDTNFESQKKIILKKGTYYLKVIRRNNYGGAYSIYMK